MVTGAKGSMGKYTAQPGRAKSKMTQVDDRKLHIIIIVAKIITEYDRK